MPSVAPRRARPTASRRSRVVVAVSLGVLVLSGCARAGDKLGQGDDVGFCPGWNLLMGLEEPPLDERDEVLRWAEGAGRILERIDVRIEVDDDPLPGSIKDDLEVVEDSVADFVEDLRGADTVDAVRQAQRDFADGAWNTTTASLSQFEEAKCQ